MLDYLEEIKFIGVIIVILFIVIFAFIYGIYDIKVDKEIKFKELELQYQNTTTEENVEGDN